MLYHKHNLAGIALVALLFGAAIPRAVAQDAEAEPESPNSGGFFGGPSVPVLGGVGNQGDQRSVQTDDLIIAWSEGNDELRGFSQKSGEWTNLPIQPQKKVVPVVAGAVGAVRVGDTFAAYSSETGRWNVLPLVKNSKAVQVVHSRLVQVNDGGHMYTFAAANGRWTSPSDPEFQQKTTSYGMTTSENRNVFSRVFRWAESLPPHEFHGRMSVSPNRLEVTAYRKSWLQAVQNKIEEIRAEVQAAKTTRTEAMDMQQDTDAYVSVSEVTSPVTPLQLSALRKTQAKLEATVNALVKELRSKKSPSEDERKQLRKLIDQLFEARQKQETAQLESLRKKVDAISENLKARSQQQPRIVDRRVEELLDPAVQWAATAPSRNPGIPGGNPAGRDPFGMPATGTPIGPSGPAHLPGVSGSASGGVKQNPAGLNNSGSGVDGTGRGRLAQPTSQFNQAVSEEAIAKRLAEWREKAQKRIGSIDGLKDRLTRRREGDRQGGNVKEMITLGEKAIAAETAYLELDKAGWKQAWRAYQTAIKQAQLRVLESEVQIEAADERLDRMKKLKDRGYVGPHEFNTAGREAEVLKIKCEAVRSELELLKSIAENSPHLDPSNMKAAKKSKGDD